MIDAPLHDEVVVLEWMIRGVRDIEDELLIVEQVEFDSAPLKASNRSFSSTRTRLYRTPMRALLTPVLFFLRRQGHCQRRQA